MLKEKFLCLFVMGTFFISTVNVESKIPSTVMQILDDKDKTDKAKARIQVAKTVKEHLEAVEAQSFTLGAANQENGVVAVVEYLCPHCHLFLKDLKNIDFKANKIKLSVLALPVFATQQSKQFDIILQKAYQSKPSEYVNILADYKRNDKDSLVKLVRETYKIDLSDDLINNNVGAQEQEKLLADLGIPFVPMLFFVMNDKANNKLVIPLANIPAGKLEKLVKSLEKLDDNEVKKLKEALGQ